MTLEKFVDTYNERRDFYENYPFQALLKKTYLKFRKGSEVRFQDVSKFEENSTIMSDVLINVPQIQLVKDRIKQSLQTVLETREADVRIVYGDYGHGKSQTAHLLVEELEKGSNNSVFIHLENIATFKNFFVNLSKNRKKQLGEEIPTDLQKFFSIFEDSSSEVGVSMLIHSFIEYLQCESNSNMVHVVILDELDKIVHDEIERKNWIDLFVSLNDESDLPILLVCLIPQRMATILINSDRRLERWNHFFSINSTSLDGRYSTEVLNAIATILALNDFYHQTRRETNSLQYTFDVIEQKLHYLETTTIRNVNTWVIIFGELLLQYENFGIWDKYNSIDEIKRYDLLKSNLIKLIKSDNLPNFELSRDDSEEKDLYRIEFTEDLSGNMIGSFNLLINFQNTEKLVKSVNICVETGDRFNEDESHEKLILLSDNNPVIVIILGMNSSKQTELNQKYLNEQKTHVERYSIKFITIPLEICSPLILLSEDESHAQYNQILSSLVNWSTIITGHREELEYIIKETPSEIARRGILLRSLQLADITIDKIKSHSEVSSSEEPIDISTGIIFMAANIVSTVEEVNTFKYLSTIEKNVSDTLMFRFPNEAIEVLQEFDNIINKLHDEKLLFKGGAKRFTIKKTKNWDSVKAIQIIKQMYVEE
ncbi:MAG: hypothetical protein OEZ01_03525 [Candidatus Heimdallarchaeota archaeon]|nr:hypothetical protein [Candidatus Heimdallarchaeota archaeon]MDH5645048.1 hypothetical protein [Candidatus Heimdallarchaeota archaeon]